jgi:hypothetical protein
MPDAAAVRRNDAGWVRGEHLVEPRQIRVERRFARAL